MDTRLTLDRLRTVFVDVLNLDSAVDVDTLEYGKVEGWDSLAHMQLVAELEDTFDVMLEADDVVAMSSFSEAVSILNRNGVEFDG